MNHDKTTAELAEQMAERLLSADAVLKMPVPEWLVEGILPVDGLGVLFGKPGVMKSFMALDLGCCIATGAPFMLDYPVKQGRVLYIAAEGKTGMSIRLEAWMTRFGVDELPDFFLYPQAIPLSDERYGPAAVEMARTLAPKLVVIDTLARSMGGADENSTRDMGKLMDTIDHIRQATGAMVLMVHHTTKGGEQYRGNSSLEGAMDTMLQMRREEGTGTLTLECFKQKEGEQFAPLALGSEVITVRGGTATSCVIFPQSRLRKAEIRATKQTLILQALFNVPVGMEYTAKQVAEMAGLDHKNVGRELKSLVERGLVIMVKGGRMGAFTLNQDRRAEISSMLPQPSSEPSPHGDLSSLTPGAGKPPSEEKPKGEAEDDDDPPPLTLECGD